MRGSPRSGKRRSPSGPRRAPWLVEDRLWERLEPILCDPPRRTHHPGRRRGYAPRQCLEGILFLLFTGMRYRDVPQGLGFPSGETCRRRLQEWMRRDAWAEAMRILIVELDQAGKLDWQRVVVDASIVDAKKGATWSVQAPSTAGFPAPSITSR